MNDEQNREVATLVFQATKLTAEVMIEAMEKFVNDYNAIKEGVSEKLHPGGDEVKHGKMTLKELMEQNQGAQAIEIPNDGIKDFVKIAKEHKVDFAIKKDKTTDPPTYMCFFKAKDMDVIQDAFKEFIKKQELKKDGPTFHKTIENAKEVLKKHRERAKEKKRSREETL